MLIRHPLDTYRLSDSVLVEQTPHIYAYILYLCKQNCVNVWNRDLHGSTDELPVAIAISSCHFLDGVKFPVLGRLDGQIFSECLKKSRTTFIHLVEISEIKVGGDRQPRNVSRGDRRGSIRPVICGKVVINSRAETGQGNLSEIARH